MGASAPGTTRRPDPSVPALGGFEEEHSHATSHVLQPRDRAPLSDPARPLVLVDDELTTGTTVLNTLAAHQLHVGPLIVVDFGTATTFDVVDDDGAYLGGVIAPGINLSIEALHKAAARLPRIGIGRPQAVIGRSTIPAMQSGIYWGYVAMVEGLVARIRAEFDREPRPGEPRPGEPRPGEAEALKVVATGGLAPLLAEGTTVIDTIDPDLTLDGLRLLAERNPAPTFGRDRIRMNEGD